MAKDVEWVELAAYARAQGIPERTLRRRLTALHAQRGDVLKASDGSGRRVGKWLFNPAALRAPAAPPAPAELDRQRQLAELVERIARLEARAERMRKETVGLRARLNKVRG